MTTVFTRCVALCLAMGCSGVKAYTDLGDTDDPPPAGDADTDADSDADADTDTDADADTDTDTPWSHTIVVDGDASDFGPAETFATSSGGPTLTGVTWDATHLYVAAVHPDVGAGGTAHWVLVYTGDGTGSGSTTGVLFNTQEPQLSFAATRLVRWKADGSFDSLMTWTGSAWSDAPGYLGTGGSAVAENDALSEVELAIPLADLGATGVLDVHISWLYEGAGYESSYAATPDASFADGYDPDYTLSYHFDLTGSTAPADHAPL